MLEGLAGREPPPREPVEGLAGFPGGIMAVVGGGGGDDSSAGWVVVEVEVEVEDKTILI